VVGPVDLNAIASFLRSFWTVWLMLLFVGVLFWALRPRNKDKFDEASRIPFKDEGQEK
jgi:cytochrome c oxidase cbb3-type subunit IV